MKKYNLKIKEVVKETADAITIRFENPEEGKLQYEAGQFLTLITFPEAQEERRAYSLCSSPFIDEFPAVTVKKVENGKVSQFLNEYIAAGDTLEVLEPSGVFTTKFKSRQKRHVIMFGGGSGITPLMSLMKSILTQEAKSIVSLIYANRDIDSIIFKKELEELQNIYGKRLNIRHILEKAPDENWQEPTGYLNPDLIKTLIKSFPKFTFNPTEYFMCGPAGMMEQVELAFQKMKISSTKLRKESFTASIDTKTITEENKSLATQKVTVHYSGEVYEFEVKAEQTILEAAQKNDIDLPYSCQGGMCTACMGKATSGKVKMDTEDALMPQEIEQGYVLTCVGHPLTDDVVIEID